MSGLLVIVILVIAVVVGGIPAYVIGKRRNVETPGVAFVPVVGPTIVILWSIARSGWLCVLTLIPLVNIVFDIWLIIEVPRSHDRSSWWSVAFIVPGFNLVVFYLYAFTMEEPATAGGPTGA